MVVLEFGVNNKYGSILPCVNCSGCWWWNHVGNNLLAHFGPLVPIKHCLNVTVYLSIVADHVHSFKTTVYHLLMATFRSIMCHITKLKSSQTGFLNMKMSLLYSNDQISIQ